MTNAFDPHRWDEVRRRNRSQGLSKRVFRVVGAHTIAGKCQGETVELELTDDQADALIIAGHVVEVAPGAAADLDESACDDGDSESVEPVVEVVDLDVPPGPRSRRRK